MSGYNGGFNRGDKVFFNGKKKTIKDYFFTVDTGVHNSDLIVFIFTDNTTSGRTGLSKISKRR